MLSIDEKNGRRDACCGTSSSPSLMRCHLKSQFSGHLIHGNWGDGHSNHGNWAHLGELTVTALMTAELLINRLMVTELMLITARCCQSKPLYPG